MTELKLLEENLSIFSHKPNNIALQMGEDEQSIQFLFRVKKTIFNRFKYWMFCKFFPFKIKEWKSFKEVDK